MNVILGCGISGLIASQFIRNCMVIERSDKVASDFLDDSFPKFLHDTQHIQQLFNTFGITPVVKQFKVGIYDSTMHDFYNYDEDKMQIYEKYCIKKYGQIVENKMNGFLDNSPPSYISNKQQLIDEMYEARKNRIFLCSEVKNIDTEERSVLTKSRKVYYNKLISTLPIDIFNKLANVEIKNIKYLTINTITTSLSSAYHDLDFVYVPDNDYSFHRVNCSSNRKKLIFEFSNNHNIEDCNRFLKDFKIESADIKSFRFPITSEKLIIDNVCFIGRFSEGNYKLKVEDIIDESRQISKDV